MDTVVLFLLHSAGCQVVQRIWNFISRHRRGLLIVGWTYAVKLCLQPIVMSLFDMFARISLLQVVLQFIANYEHWRGCLNFLWHIPLFSCLTWRKKIIFTGILAGGAYYFLKARPTFAKMSIQRSDEKWHGVSIFMTFAEGHNHLSSVQPFFWLMISSGIANYPTKIGDYYHPWESCS